MKITLIKLLIILPILIAICLIFGCADIKANNFLINTPAQTTYFHKGVYKAVSPESKNKDRFYFYVFYDEQSGNTQDNILGIGLPFSCKQTKNTVKFQFADVEEPEEVFKIKSVKNKEITGSFEDGSLIIFTLIPNVNPDKFDAAEYGKKN